MEDYGTISKQSYIISAYDIISKEGIEALSIRRLASELGCNSANLYRYFQSLDELITYASVRYLKDYIREVGEIIKSTSDPLSVHIRVWKCFASCTFHNPEVFNNLFWSRYSSSLETILQDYYCMFGEELTGIDSETSALFLSGNFNYRDYFILSRTVRAGLFTEQQAQYLNRISMHMYKGFFKDLLDTDASLRDTEGSLERFMDCLTHLFHVHLELNGKSTDSLSGF